MPKKLVWTPALEDALRRLREAGNGWEAIGRALGISANAALERGRRLKVRMRRETRVVDEADPHRPPLPPGHAQAWGVLVAGTLLEGVRFEPLGPMGRVRGRVVGD